MATNVLSSRWVGVIGLLLALVACGGEDSAGESAVPELVVYSARKEHLIKPLFERYEELTGVRVRYITDEAGPLLARLTSEGANSRADLLMTVDAGNLWHAARDGALAPVESRILSRNVPVHLADPEGRWYGLTVRARTMVFATERVQARELGSYAALADARWRGRLCLRTSKKVYNQSLVAAMIAGLGPERTEVVVRGWVENLAVQPFANDTMAMEALLAGQCDVTLVNTYYYGSLQQQYAAAGRSFPLGLFWADQQGRGTHINISGAGVTRHAPHPEAAKALLEWLTEVEAQNVLVALNQEYPVNPEATLTAQMQAWGGFKPDSLPVVELGRRQAEAVVLMDRAGWR